MAQRVEFMFPNVAYTLYIVTVYRTQSMKFELEAKLYRKRNLLLQANSFKKYFKNLTCNIYKVKGSGHLQWDRQIMFVFNYTGI